MPPHFFLGLLMDVYVCSDNTLWNASKARVKVGHIQHLLLNNTNISTIYSNLILFDGEITKIYYIRKTKVITVLIKQLFCLVEISLLT